VDFLVRLFWALEMPIKRKAVTKNRDGFSFFKSQTPPFQVGQLYESNETKKAASEGGLYISSKTL
jgi:hypothetical protein